MAHGMTTGGGEEKHATKVLATGAARAGWTYKTGFRRPTCPDCQKRADQEKHMTQKVVDIMPHGGGGGGWSPGITPARLNGRPPRDVNVVEIPLAGPVVVNMQEPPTETKEPPTAKVATLRDRQRIAAALDDRYDTTAGRYKGNSTDVAIGEELSVPRAWVTSVREMLYGPSGANEAQASAAPALAALRQRLTALEEKTMADLIAIREELDRVERRLLA